MTDNDNDNDTMNEIDAWRRVLEFMNRYSTGTHTIGLVFEHAWHAIFGDEWLVLDIEVYHISYQISYYIIQSMDVMSECELIE